MQHPKAENYLWKITGCLLSCELNSKSNKNLSEKVHEMTELTWEKNHVETQDAMSPHCLSWEMKIPLKWGCLIMISPQHTRCPYQRVDNLSGKFQQPAFREIFRYWKNTIVMLLPHSLQNNLTNDLLEILINCWDNK